MIRATRHRSIRPTFSAAEMFQTLESRQLMSGTIPYLDTSGTAAPVGDDPRGVVAVDVNGDGNPDIISANGTGLSVAIGDGNGGFTLTTDLVLGKQALEVHAADLNGDGKVDLVAGLIFGDYITLAGNGDGTFGAPAELAFDVATPESNFSLVDLNADGKQDFVSGVAIGPSGVLIRYNTSTGDTISFDPERVVASDAVNGQAVPADVNGDGKPDLIGLGDGVAVLINTGVDATTGRATFAPAAKYATTFQNPRYLSAVDLNGDAKPDVTAGYTSTAFDVLLNASDGTFGVAIEASHPTLVSVFADANGDGKLDAVGTKPVFGPRLAIALGNGDGTFAKPGELTLGNVSFNESAVADVNSDGRPDVLIVDNDEDRVVILKGTNGEPTSDPSDDPTTDPTTDPTDEPAQTDDTPVTDLTVSAPSGLAETLRPGDKAAASVTVTNSGEKASNGTVAVRLFASSDNVLDDSDVLLTTLSKKLKLAAQKAKALALKFVVPSGIGDGAFNILTEVTGGGDEAATNNVVASAAPVQFATPKIDAAVTLTAPSSLTAGKRTNASVNVTNAGGAAIDQAARVVVYSTTNGTLDGSEIELAAQSVTLKLKAGKAKKLKLSFTVPTELSGQNRILVARLELAGDVVAGNNVAISPSIPIG